MPDPESDTTIETIRSAVGRLMDDAWVDQMAASVDDEDRDPGF